MLTSSPYPFDCSGRPLDPWVPPRGHKKKFRRRDYQVLPLAPEGEKGAGDKVLMLQQDHDTIHVWRDESTSSERGAAEVWHRCNPRTS